MASVSDITLIPPKKTRLVKSNTESGRRAFTVLEVTVAAGMLAMLLASAMQMVRLVSVHQRLADRRTVALQAIQSVSDEIANMPWEKLTAASAAQVAIPNPLQSYLPGVDLKISVADEALPVPNKRLRVELAWSGTDGRPVAPVRLTTWIYLEQPASK